MYLRLFKMFRKMLFNHRKMGTFGSNFFFYMLAFRFVMNNKTINKLIVSLDLQHLDRTLELIELLSPIVNYFKIGSIPFFKHGSTLLKRLCELDKKVFLDLKWHDIPNTVEGVVKAASMNSTIFMMNVHCSGGEAMLKAAVECINQLPHRPLLMGVTVLTSLKQADLLALGFSDSIPQQVLKLATLAQKSGLDGVVASAHEVQELKKNFGRDFLVVTPGIRPEWSIKNDDQQRVLTPSDALESGSDYLVVGRPIIANANPLQATQRILEEMDTVA